MCSKLNCLSCNLGGLESDMFEEKRKHSCCKLVLIKALQRWKTSVNNGAAFFKYLTKQWRHYLSYYWRQRQSSWLCVRKGRTSVGWCFVLPTLVSSFRVLSVELVSSLGSRLGRGVENVDRSTKTNYSRHLVPHKDNLCSNTASVKALNKLLSAVSETDLQTGALLSPLTVNKG